MGIPISLFPATLEAMMFEAARAFANCKDPDAKYWGQKLMIILRTTFRTCEKCLGRPPYRSPGDGPKRRGPAVPVDPTLPDDSNFGPPPTPVWPSSNSSSLPASPPSSPASSLPPSSPSSLPASPGSLRPAPWVSVIPPRPPRRNRPRPKKLCPTCQTHQIGINSRQCTHCHMRVVGTSRRGVQVRRAVTTP
jgi:hypothetical protein